MRHERKLDRLTVVCQLFLFFGELKVYAFGEIRRKRKGFELKDGSDHMRGRSI